jgi:hypothetical protein
VISETQSKVREELIKKLSQLDDRSFDSLASEVYAYQRKYNKVYDEYCNHFSKKDTPLFLPISAFKFHEVVSGAFTSSDFFESSGTTSTFNSRHYVYDVNLYLDNATKIFEQFYGRLEDYCFLALLPHYLERQHSSLVCMVQHFIKQSGNEHSGFYLNDLDALSEKLLYCQQHKIKTILFGVSFALLDYSESHPTAFPDLIIMETGGMKGRREEITKEALHKHICDAFSTKHVHSEYGMTELFSQAYSDGEGRFYCPHSMKISITELNDPMTQVPNGKAGIINITDLANIDSCSFITTEDIGIVYDDGSFTILGRLDQSDLRGCNLLVSDL